jgi:hypothetical protein
MEAPLSFRIDLHGKLSIPYPLPVQTLRHANTQFAGFFPIFLMLVLVLSPMQERDNFDVLLI